MTEPRLTVTQRRDLLLMNFTHVVYIARDVSVRSIGSVEGAFRSWNDAGLFASLLDKMYEVDGAFQVATV
jgi:hypothetical protein